MNDLSSRQYSVNKNIRFKTSMLKSDLCDYSDVYIVVKRGINIRAIVNAFKDNAPFRSCITKINSKLIENT